MPNFEYHKFETRSNRLMSVDNQPTPGEKMTDLEHLNAFGKDGWELVSAVHQNQNDMVFLMKRERK